MSQLDLQCTAAFAVWANAFSADELDWIEAYGDRLTAEKACVANAAQGEVRRDIRVTQTAWLAPNAETQWIYARLQGVARALNDRTYQFSLSGFSENLQYTVYLGSERGHYDWHVDQGPLQTRRKLSLSLQLTDPTRYEGCDLQFQAGNQVENAPKDRGAVIAFPSYVLHRVTPCIKGARKAIVAWTTGPQFR